MNNFEIATTLLAVVAILVSVFNLGWNIYRDVIQKPTFRISVAKKLFVHEHKQEGPFIIVEALNLGPTSNRIGLIFARPSWWGRRIKSLPSGLVIHDRNHPYSTTSASKVEVGDSAIFVIPYQKDCFLEQDIFSQIGMADGYGKMHWARRSQLRSLKKQYFEDFRE